jgi:hypothetical protein
VKTTTVRAKTKVRTRTTVLMSKMKKSQKKTALSKFTTLKAASSPKMSPLVASVSSRMLGVWSPSLTSPLVSFS